MNLSRAHLESDYFQKLATENARHGRPRPLSPEQLEHSLSRTLETAPDIQDIWIFGYGSLIWNPLLEFDKQLLVTLHGYRRRFCLKTELSRGSPDAPGLILGLEPGGSCRGIAYRLAGTDHRDELLLLWKREMVTGAYSPRWVKLRSKDGDVVGLAFVMNREYPYYVSGLSDEQTAAMLAHACGPLGTCAEYLFNTETGLREHGIHDAHLHKLVKRVHEIHNGQTLA